MEFKKEMNDLSLKLMMIRAVLRVTAPEEQPADLTTDLINTSQFMLNEAINHCDLIEKGFGKDA